jgi:predicted TIM-barrel fold metal-dependent hydrolase
MRIDVHAHFLPPSFFDLMDAHDAAQRVESFSVYGPMLRGGADRLFSAGPVPVIEDWIAQLHRSGFQLAVLSLGALQPYFPDEGSGAAVARQANVMLRSAVDQGDGWLAAFGSLPLPHLGPALAELRFCLDECGFAGINLGTSVCGLALDDPALDDMWAALDERRATVFIHPGTTPRMGPGSAEYHLAPDFCSPTETALALCRLVVGKVTTRYPHVRIIAAAMGGSLPFFAHRFDAGMRKSHPGLYEELGGVLPQLRRLWYDTSMTEEPYALDSVRHSVGIDRLVFGSDLPRGPLADAVSFVTSSPLLTEQEKTQILDDQGVQALGQGVPASTTGPR